MRAVAHVTPWGLACGVARHLRYWLDHHAHASARRSVVLAEHPPVWHSCVENWNTLPAVRCWNRGAANALACVRQQVEHHGAQIIHWQFDPSFFTFQDMESWFDWARAAGVRTIATMHIVSADDVYLWETKSLLRNADQIVVGTPRMVAALNGMAERFGISLHRPPRLIPLAAPEAPARAERLHGAWPRVLTWGFLGWGKGHEEVLQAVELLRRTLAPDAQYVVLGKAMTVEQQQTRDRLLALAAQRSWLSVRAEFMDDDMLSALCQQADVIVLNHQYRNISSSGTVAVSVVSGTPTVVSNSPMFSGYAEAGAVRVAAPGAAGMADAIADALTNPGALRAGVETMRAQTRPAAVAAAYEQLYQEMDS